MNTTSDQHIEKTGVIQRMTILFAVILLLPAMAIATFLWEQQREDALKNNIESFYSKQIRLTLTLNNDIDHLQAIINTAIDTNTLHPYIQNFLLRSDENIYKLKQNQQQRPQLSQASIRLFMQYSAIADTLNLILYRSDQNVSLPNFNKLHMTTQQLQLLQQLELETQLKALTNDNQNSLILLSLITLIAILGSALLLPLFKKINITFNNKNTIQSDLDTTRQQLSILLNEGHEAILSVKPNMRCKFANSACAEKLGFADRTDLIDQDMTPFILSQAASTEECENIRLAIINGEKYEANETVLLTHQGRGFNAHLTVSPTLDEDQIHICSIITFNDITASQHMRSELTTHQGMLAKAQEIASIGSWDWDIINNTLKWSAETYKIFGTKPHTAYTNYEQFLAKIHPDDRELVSEAVSRSLNNPEIPYNIQHRIIREDGTERTIAEQAVIYWDNRNEPVRMIGTVHDITERLKTDKLKDKFVSMINHEIRTPLTNINGALEIIASEEFKRSQEEQDVLIEIARNNTYRLKLLIDDILDLQEIEADRINFDFEQINMTALSKQLIRDNRPQADQKNITLKINQSEDNTWVHGDKNRLAQVISNILSNAVRFSPAHNNVDISIFSQNNHVFIEITDYGTGIEKEFLTRIYDKFTQAESAEARPPGSTGLGLSLAYMITKKHGGHIEIETEEAVGSCFRIILPTAA